jgi:CDP-diacylglycerol---glycerol-3-phosphate 3-phosphatidyltransferase
MSLYRLKPAFQNLLRPLVGKLAAAGVTANHVTLAAAAVSVALGAWLCSRPADHRWFALLPLWFLLRMAFNAIDGMLAREHKQQSALGAYLNELADVVSDSALYLPFAFVAPFGPAGVGAVILAAALAEYAGVLGLMVGASRRYDGPLGKSDRAFVFGALGLAVAVFGTLPGWLALLMPLLALLLVWTLVNRVRAGIAEGAARTP